MHFPQIVAHDLLCAREAYLRGLACAHKWAYVDQLRLEMRPNGMRVGFTAG